MAAKKKKTTPGRAVRRFFVRLLALAALAVLIVSLVWGNVVTLSCTTLPLDALPVAFDGVKIVYVSDLHITTLNSVGKVNALFRQLERLQPDLLLLGGDYTGTDVAARIVSRGDTQAYNAILVEMRDLFFLELAGFDAPLGKYAVAGDMDNLLERGADAPLEDAAALGGVTLLRDESVRVVKDGQTLVIAGVDDWRTGMQDVRSPASGVSAADCAIVLSHNPEAVPQLNNQPAEGGGLWIDAALTGHTLGGLIRLGDYELFSPLARDARYGAGWHTENEAKMLVSRGLCGALVPVRLGATAQVHLITLAAKE